MDQVLYKKDFVSTSYDKEIQTIKICKFKFYVNKTDESDNVEFKILVNPSDQCRALRVIVGCTSPAAIDASFASVPAEIHSYMCLVNIAVAKALEIAGAHNVNVRTEGNNRFKVGEEEREGLHSHVIGRFPNGTLVLGIYTIDHEPGLEGDIPLGTNKKPITADQLSLLRVALRTCMRQAVEYLSETQDIFKFFTQVDNETFTVSLHEM